MISNWIRRDFSKLAALTAVHPPAVQGAADAIESAFSPKDGRWHIEWPGRLSQHDLVYLSPPEDPTLGLPIGNGDLGALLWTNARGLVSGFPSWPFRHFDNEAMPIVRICPSVPAGWGVRFDLASGGGFRVSVERRNGKVLFVSVESRLGGRCRLVHPWPEESACVDVTAEYGPGEIALADERAGVDPILRWETEAGHRYLLVPAQTTLENCSGAREVFLKVI